MTAYTSNHDEKLHFRLEAERFPLDMVTLGFADEKDRRLVGEAIECLSRSLRYVLGHYRSATGGANA